MAETRDTSRNADPRATTSDRLASMAHETVDKVADTARSAEQQARGAASRAADKAREAEGRMRTAADEGLTTIRSYVEQNPLASAGIAFAAGIVVSSLLRR